MAVKKTQAKEKDVEYFDVKQYKDWIFPCLKHERDSAEFFKEQTRKRMESSAKVKADKAPKIL